MNEELLKRINELSRKQRSEGLTPEELKEQQELRAEYLKAFRAHFTDVLENTYLQRPDGTKEKVQRKPKH